MKHQKSLRNILSAVTFVTSFVAVALWQFYTFVTFRNAAGAMDLQGGEKHMWLAILFALIACFVAFLMFSIFLRYDRSDELHITSPPPPREMIL